MGTSRRAVRSNRILVRCRDCGGTGIYDSGAYFAHGADPEFDDQGPCDACHGGLIDRTRDVRGMDPLFALSYRRTYALGYGMTAQSYRGLLLDMMRAVPLPGSRYARVLENCRAAIAGHRQQVAA